MKPHTGASGKTIFYLDDRNLEDRNLDGGNITSFLSSLVTVSKWEQVSSSEEEEKVPSAEEAVSSYHPGIYTYF